MNKQKFKRVLDDITASGIQFVAVELDEEVAAMRLGGHNNVTTSMDTSQGNVEVLVTDGKRISSETVILDKDDIVDGLRSAIANLSANEEYAWFKGFPTFTPKHAMRNGDKNDIENVANILRKGLLAFHSKGLNLSGVAMRNQYRYRIYGSQSRNAQGKHDVFDQQIHWNGSYYVIAMKAFQEGTDLGARILGAGRAQKDLNLDDLFGEALTQIDLERSLPVASIPIGKQRVALSYRTMPFLLDYTTNVLFDGEAYELGIGGLQDLKKGDAAFSPTVTLANEPWHPLFPCHPLADMYGAPVAKKTTHIKQGVFGDRQYSTLNAQRYGKDANGIDGFVSLNAPHLHPGTGPSDLAEVARAVEDGLIVQDLHYLNTSGTQEGAFTGIGYNGTFLVKNGAIVARIPDARINGELRHLWQNVAWCSAKERLVPSMDIYGAGPHMMCVAPMYVCFETVPVANSFAIDVPHTS